MDSAEESSIANETLTQEPLLNISASQLVQIMTCAMKRKDIESSSNQPIPNKKQCVGITQKAKVGQDYNTKTKQELIERNRYLERKVKQLETLNYNLQYGLLDTVRRTIEESLHTQLQMNNLALRRTTISQDKTQPMSSFDTNDNQQTWQPMASLEEPLVNDVTSTTTRTPDLCSEILSGEESQSPQTSRSFNLAPPTLVKSERLFNNPETLQLFQNPQAEVLNSTSPLQSSSSESNHQYRNTLISSNTASSRLLGMAHEIQTIVQESTNYKKLTNKLLSALFDREELAGNTLTGKSKGDQGKGKLDEDTVNLIVQQAIMRFPGTSSTDVRMVISQNCKDKALRLQRKIQREALQKQRTQQPLPGISYITEGM